MYVHKKMSAVVDRMFGKEDLCLNEMNIRFIGKSIIYANADLGQGCNSPRPVVNLYIQSSMTR
jgi:hypothetical protein